MPAVASPTRHVCIAAADRTMAAVGSGHAGPTAPWTLPSSLLLHILLFGIVIAMPQQRWVRPQQEKILVRILTPQQYRAATAGDDPQAVTRGPEPVYASPSPDRFGTLPATPPIPRKPEPPAMIRAVKILSGEALADARSRQARIALRQLSDFDRREQLCNLEAMEQVHAWDGDYEPERLVAYAMEDTRITGNVVQAGGAAFRSKRQWYNLEYRCEVTPDLVAVTAFEFRVGEPIPRRDWRAHYLPERY